MILWAPISAGELFDKITILRLKAARIADPAKRHAVAFELRQLEAIAAKVTDSPGLRALVAQLHAINTRLWDIENAKRAAEARQDFGDAFVALARAVYRENDRRAEVKAAINRLVGSEIVEQKSYSGA
ncbi:MAG: DUF6165 family protein [Pseudomonadota bacterium]